MGKPLSMDMRRRALAAVDAGMSRRAAAGRFGVSVSSVIRWDAQKRETGGFAASAPRMPSILAAHGFSRVSFTRRMAFRAKLALIATKRRFYFLERLGSSHLGSSLHGKVWPPMGAAASATLRASGPVEEIVTFPVLALRYGALWDNIDALAQFVGFPVSLPTRRPRESASMVVDETKARVRQMYAELDVRIAGLADLSMTRGTCKPELT